MEQRLVHHCGTRLEEWNPDAGGDPHAYVAEIWVCPACKMKQDMLDSFRRDNKGRDGASNGVEVRLIPRRSYQARIALQRSQLQKKRDEELEDREARGVRYSLDGGLS